MALGLDIARRVHEGPGMVGGIGNGFRGGTGM
jgi:hypothetical protein